MNKILHPNLKIGIQKVAFVSLLTNGRISETWVGVKCEQRAHPLPITSLSVPLGFLH